MCCLDMCSAALSWLFIFVRLSRANVLNFDAIEVLHCRNCGPCNWCIGKVSQDTLARELGGSVTRPCCCTRRDLLHVLTFEVDKVPGRVEHENHKLIVAKRVVYVK